MGFCARKFKRKEQLRAQALARAQAQQARAQVQAVRRLKHILEHCPRPNTDGKTMTTGGPQIVIQKQSV